MEGTGLVQGLNAITAAIDPIALRLGPLTIHWYGVIIGFGVFVATWWSSKEADKKGLPKDFMVDLLFWLLPLGILGARVYYIVFSWDYYGSRPHEWLAIWQGGGAIYGGLLAGAAVIVWYCRKRQVPLAVVLDIIAPTVLLAQAIGRWGNFVNQEAYGGAVSQQWLSSWLPDFMVQQMTIDGVAYHPTFLYESILSVIGVVGIVWLRSRNKCLLVSETAMAYVVWYGVSRTIVEGMRSDSLMLGPLRVSQVLSIVLVIGAVCLWVYRRKQGGIRYYSEIPPL